MSAGVSSGGGRGRGDESQDFELNLASIIDCFTVLITFMLASASFISINLMDAGVAAAGATSTNSAPPEVMLTLEIGKANAMTLKLSGKANRSIPIPAREGQQDLKALTEQLAAAKKQWPSTNAMTLSAEDNIPYNEVIKAMETSRETIPVVLLGGF